MNKYVALFASLLYIGLLIGATILGHQAGSSKVQGAWDKERKLQLELDLKQSVGALDESRELARAASEQHRKDLEEAIRASEERQAKRTEQSLRRAVLEAGTREGPYVSPECVLDEETFEILQEQLNEK